MTDSNVVKFQRPIRWDNLRSDEAKRVVQDLAKDTGKVTIGLHANEREDERGSITSLNVLDILRTGDIFQTPKKNDLGDWEVEVEKRMRGGRDAVAITIIISEGKSLFVKTVMWRDL